MINPNMKFEGVQEISEIIFEDDPTSFNQNEIESSLIEKSKLNRRVLTQMDHSDHYKKSYLPCLKSMLRQSETEYLSKSYVDSLGLEQTMPKKLLSTCENSFSKDHMNAKRTLKKIEGLKRSDSEHCFPKNRFSVQDVPLVKRNTFFNRGIKVSQATVQNNK
jgi:hypothetical protein